jgi:large subunit ribosomal protein L6
MNMAKLPDIKEEITISNGVKVTLEQDTLTVTGEKGSLSREFLHPKVTVKVNGNMVEITCKNPRRKDKAFAGTFAAHIKNMIKGVTGGFEYQMKTVFSHFPIKTSVEENEFIIQNFLGERAARKAKILEGVTVETKGEDITVSGIDKEKVGQTVANIERATKVKKRDIRVFQDGVYRISRGEK